MSLPRWSDLSDLAPEVLSPWVTAGQDNQFFRQMVPNTGPYGVQVNTEAVKSRNVRAIVSYEPGFDFPFPEGEVPPSMTLGGRPLSAITVPQSDFMLLTKIPIIICYGDNIPDKPSAHPGQEQWRIFFEMAKRWRDV